MTAVVANVLRTVNHKTGLTTRARNSDKSGTGVFLDIASPTTPDGATPLGPLHDTPRPSKEPASENSAPRKRSASEEADIHSAAQTPSGTGPTTRPGRSAQPFAEAPKDPKRARKMDTMEEEESLTEPTAQVPQPTPPIPGPDSRHKGPCSYEHCPNPHHSSGGGFKVVTAETKAGNRCWAEYRGRVFCNACFTQFATRGTFQRPGRNLPAGGVAPTLDQVAPLKETVAQARPVAVSRMAEQRAEVARAPKPVVALKPLPERMEVEESEDPGCNGSVVLELLTEGRNLRYQWLRDGRPIPGAHSDTLHLQGSECRGDISCIVSNEWGSTPPFAPVQLPARAQEAARKLMADKSAPPPPKEYNLRCVCGEVTRGTPEMLATEPCHCGKLCCGVTEPIRMGGWGG